MKFYLFLIFFTSCSLFAQVEYNIIGDAYADGDCYVLTPEQNSQSGAIWYLETVSLSESFDIRYELRFGGKDSNGADGIAFVLQPISNSEGSSGGGIGYQGIQPSLAIEMDTYQNGNWGDPSYDHIALQANGDNNHNTANALTGFDNIVPGQNNVEDNEWYYFRVVWDATANSLRCWVNCELRIDYTDDIITNFFNGDDEVFWGFTSGTGALNNWHVVCPVFVSFIPLEDIELCAGETQQVIADNNFETHSWSPASIFNDATIYNPTIINATQNTQVIWQGTDKCGEIATDTFEVVITNIPDLPDNLQVCNGETLNLDLSAYDNVTWVFPPIPNPVIDQNMNVVLDVEINGCVKQEVINVTLKPQPQLNNIDAEVCEGSEVFLDGTFDGVNWISPIGNTGNSVIVNNDVNIEVELELDGCLETFTFNVTITDEPTFSLPSSVCPDEMFELTGNFDDVNWINPISFSGTENSVSQNALLEFELILNGCVKQFTHNILVDDLPTLSVPLEACENETIEVTGSFDSLTWLNPSTNAGNTIEVNGDITLEIEATLGNCKDDFSFDVSAKPLPNLDLNYIACSGEVVTITGDYDNLMWQSSNGNGNSLTILIPESIEVEADLDGCLKSFTITTDTLDCTPPKACVELVPTAFSPNNDGFNDEYKPLISNCPIETYQLIVFNRWGQTIFISNQMGVGWNGKFKDADAEVGVYPFVVEYKSSDEEEVRIIKGNVTLIR